MNLVFVAIGSAAGGVARWLLGETLQLHWQRLAAGEPRALFPLGTLLVNVSGSLALGMLAVVLARQGAGGSTARLLLAVGFCGGYTTFSTFSLDTVSLLEGGATGLAALNVLASLALAFAGTFAGMLLMRALLGARVG